MNFLTSKCSINYPIQNTYRQQMSQLSRYKPALSMATWVRPKKLGQLEKNSALGLTVKISLDAP